MTFEMSLQFEDKDMEYMEGLVEGRDPAILANGNDGEAAPPAAKRNKVWIKLFTNKEVLFLYFNFEYVDMCTGC